MKDEGCEHGEVELGEYGDGHAQHYVHVDRVAQKVQVEEEDDASEHTLHQGGLRFRYLQVFWFGWWFRQLWIGSRKKFQRFMKFR